MDFRRIETGESPTKVTKTAPRDEIERTEREYAISQVEDYKKAEAEAGLDTAAQITSEQEESASVEKPKADIDLQFMSQRLNTALLQNDKISVPDAAKFVGLIFNATTVCTVEEKKQFKLFWTAIDKSASAEIEAAAPAAAVAAPAAAVTAPAAAVAAPAAALAAPAAVVAAHAVSAAVSDATTEAVPVNSEAASAAPEDLQNAPAAASEDDATNMAASEDAMPAKAEAS